MPFEPLRDEPRLLDLQWGEFLSSPYLMMDEPESVVPDLRVSQSLSKRVETQPEVTASRLRLRMEDLTLAFKDWLELLYWRTLLQGGRVEYMHDPTKLLLLPGDVEHDVRRHFEPLAGSVYTMGAFAGQYEQGGIGIFSADPAASITNYVKNGNFEDGTDGAIPTDWNRSGAEIGFIKSQYYITGGSVARCAKIFATTSFGGTGSIYQDMEMAAAINTLGAVGISFEMRADRAVSSTVADAVTLTVQPADASDVAVEVAQFTPKAKWTRYRYRQPMTATEFATTTDATLRLRFAFDDSLQRGAVHIRNVQVEDRDYTTGFVARSSVDADLTGSRASHEQLKVLNPLGYAAQLPKQQETLGRFAFTVDTWIEFGWASAFMPATRAMICRDTDESENIASALEVWVDSAFKINARVTLEDGTQPLLQSAAQTIALGTRMHVLVTYIDWDGSGATTGKLMLYVNGVLEGSADVGSWLKGFGDILWIGCNGPNTSNRYTLNGFISYFRADAVFIPPNNTWEHYDEEGYRVTDYYSTTVPPDRVRTAWRCVLDPGQRGSPVRLNKNAYDLDLQLLEYR
jgi:hypothetical protein